MSVLVTGASGFIGRYVVDRIQDRGEPAVTYAEAAALVDLPRLANTITAHGVRGIVHAAGMADRELSLAMPAATVAANAMGTFHLLEGARLAGFEGRIVLVSSTAVYGDDDARIDDVSPLRPGTPFAATKAFGDLLGEVYTHRYGLDVVSLRVSEPYGPGGPLPSVLEAIIDAAMARRPLRVAPSAAPPCHLVHVEDVARAIVAALDAASPAQRVYDIVGEPVRLDEVVAVMRDRAPDTAIEIDRSVVSDAIAPVAASAASRDLGYRARWSIARGIDDLCTWLEAEEAC
jgi:UDP-glucose 4-epimerase